MIKLTTTPQKCSTTQICGGQESCYASGDGPSPGPVGYTRKLEHKLKDLEQEIYDKILSKFMQVSCTNFTTNMAHNKYITHDITQQETTGKANRLLSAHHDVKITKYKKNYNHLN